MPSRAEAIAARVAAVMLAGGTNAGSRVWRDRQDALTREESPAVIVELIDEDSTAHGGAAHGIPGHARDADKLRVAVTVAVRGAQWQSVADAVLVQAHALLAADGELRALTGGGLRRDRREWRPASADLPFGYSAQIYRSQYLTRASALDSLD